MLLEVSFLLHINKKGISFAHVSLKSLFKSLLNLNLNEEHILKCHVLHLYNMDKKTQEKRLTYGINLCITFSCEEVELCASKKNHHSSVFYRFYLPSMILGQEMRERCNLPSKWGNKGSIHQGHSTKPMVSISVNHTNYHNYFYFSYYPFIGRIFSQRFKEN